MNDLICAACNRRAPGGILIRFGGSTYELCDMHSSMTSDDLRRMIETLRRLRDMERALGMSWAREFQLRADLDTARRSQLACATESRELDYQLEQARAHIAQLEDLVSELRKRRPDGSQPGGDAQMLTRRLLVIRAALHVIATAVLVALTEAQRKRAQKAGEDMLNATGGDRGA